MTVSFLKISSIDALVFENACKNAKSEESLKDDIIARSQHSRWILIRQIQTVAMNKSRSTALKVG